MRLSASQCLLLSRPDDGTKTFNLKVPDAITSWYASGFAISKQAGMRIANPMELRVFQPFFISLNLPYSVIRGEDVIVPAAIFSYLENACLSASLILQEILKFKTKIKVLFEYFHGKSKNITALSCLS